MAAPSLRDFEPDAFVLEKYIEKLSQMNPNTGLGPLSKKKDMPFDPKVLLESFESSLSLLNDLGEKIQKRVEKLEFLCAKAEKDHAGRVKQLEPTFHDAFTEFQVLEERITYVARKVVHLGDQLESSNNFRERDIEALNLLEIMKDFSEKSKPARPEFTEPPRLTEGAVLINKLNILASELPLTEKYEAMRHNIAQRYADIERQLVDKFCDALRSSDVKRMKKFASALQLFPQGADQSVQNYIHHHTQTVTQSGSSFDEMFHTVETKISKVSKQVIEVFDNAEEVMTRLIQNVTEKVLLDHVNKELKGKPTEEYLQCLYQLHRRAMLLKDALSRLDVRTDPAFLSKTLRATLFSDHLGGYAELEVRHLRDKCQKMMEEFNASVGIQKRGGVGAAIRASLTVSATSVCPEENLVSENLCLSVLIESKTSIKRCVELLSDRELSHAMRDVFLTILDILGGDHFNVAIDLAAEVKTGPIGLFLQVVGTVNKNFHLIEKQYREVIIPSIYYAPVASVCNEKKREVLTKLETKIEAGMEKCITGMVNTLKQILSGHKRTDYKPEEAGNAEVTQTCLKAVAHIEECTKVIKLSLDGKNQEVVLLEFGIRVHRVIYETILTFTVNSSGAMFLICDLNEYRRAIKDFKNPFLDEIFDNLQALCNIFIVMPNNLKQVCNEEPYVSFDRSVIMHMVQMRADYKTAKLHKVFTQ